MTRGCGPAQRGTDDVIILDTSLFVYLVCILIDFNPSERVVEKNVSDVSE